MRYKLTSPGQASDTYCRLQVLPLRQAGWVESKVPSYANGGKI